MREERRERRERRESEGGERESEQKLMLERQCSID